MNFEQVINLNKDSKVYFFGAGGVFITAIQRHKEHLQKANIVGVFDNNASKWGQIIEGYEILPLERINQCGEDDVIIITSSYVQEIKAQLQPFGFKKIYAYHDLNHIGRMFTKEEVDKLNYMKTFLADDKSRMVVDKIIEKRQKGNSDFSDIYEPDQYFVEDIVSIDENTVFVDGGAYIGDTVQVLIQKSGNRFKKVYAFEPDAINYQKLVAAYAEDDRIVPINAGLGKCHQEMHFIVNETNSEGGRVAEEGGETIIIESIDECIKDKVSFIKLDVEGFEMDTLHGAEKTIKSYKPTLTICLYHKAEDLYEIPSFIHSLVPEYKLYVRHHTKGVAETVLYAVM